MREAKTALAAALRPAAKAQKSRSLRTSPMRRKRSDSSLAGLRLNGRDEDVAQLPSVNGFVRGFCHLLGSLEIYSRQTELF